MIQSEEIRAKARRQFKNFLLAELENSGDFFPIYIPASKGSPTDNLSERKKNFEKLYLNSKNHSGIGYSLQIETKNTRKYGEQSVIKAIYFESQKDFLFFIKAEAEFRFFTAHCKILSDAFSGSILPWLKKNLLLLCEKQAPNYWPDCILCAQWFLQNPESGLYLRQIPLAVHTKFIEENKAVILSLVRFFRSDTLAEHTALSPALTFERELGLRQAESLIRLRFCQPADKFLVGNSLLSGAGTEIQELAITASDLAKIDLSDIKQIFVIENLMVYLTFPPLTATLCIFGEGFAALRLAQCDQLRAIPLKYFGDLDEQGFAILSDFRAQFPHTESFCMDSKTLEAFDEFRVAGSVLQRKEQLAKLCSEEMAALRLLQAKPEKNRLEQERIPLSYIKARIAANN